MISSESPLPMRFLLAQDERLKSMGSGLRSSTWRERFTPSITPVRTRAARSEKESSVRQLSNALGMDGNSASSQGNASVIRTFRLPVARFAFKGMRFRSPYHRRSGGQLSFASDRKAEKQVADRHRALLAS